MPKSLSNRAALVLDLQKLALEYQSKPSTLLDELERFMKVNDILPKENKAWTYKREPSWKVMGFKSKADMKAFEDRPDFPGWDAL